MKRYAERPFCNSHLAKIRSSAEDVSETFVLCFTKLVWRTPSFWATTVLGNGCSLKAEGEGQQPSMGVRAPQRG